MEYHGDMKQGRYRGLAVEIVLDFIVMYFVMYTMIATVNHFHFNLNNVYMTLMMVAPMTVIMVVSMRSMFPSRRINMAIGAAAMLVFSSASSECARRSALETPSSCAP